jgi:glycosyltransferase involved in cell wall biosynthesis
MNEGSLSRKSVRICLLTDSFYPVVGGGEGQARLMARSLRERGHEVTVLTQHRFASSPRHEVLDGVDVMRVGRPGLKRWGKYLMMPASLFKLLITAGRWDVVYVAGLRTLGVVGVAAATLTGRRCLLRSASCAELSGDYIFEHLNSGPSSRWMKALLRGYLALRNWVLLKADGFLAMSSAIEHEYLACDVDPQKIARIPNGVDLSRFRPLGAAGRKELRQALELPVEGVLMTYTGKLNRGKGLETLLRSWRRIAAEREDAHLVLVGSGGGMYLSCEAELRSYVSEHSLEGRVTFTGYQQNVHEYLQASDIYVMPSESEALSNSLIEGLSCGLPTVASAVGGMLDVVTHERDGLLVPAGDEEELAAALRRLMNDGELSARLGAAARERAQAFDVQRITTLYEQLFASLAAGSGVPCSSSEQ